MFVEDLFEGDWRSDFPGADQQNNEDPTIASRR